MKLMEFLGKEKRGALTAQKVRGETSNFNPTAATHHVHSKVGSTSRKGRSVEPFYVLCECNGHWAQTVKQ